jgi:hypothetical protein
MGQLTVEVPNQLGFQLGWIVTTPEAQKRFVVSIVAPNSSLKRCVGRWPASDSASSSKVRSAP